MILRVFKNLILDVFTIQQLCKDGKRPNLKKYGWFRSKLYLTFKNKALNSKRFLEDLRRGSNS